MHTAFRRMEQYYLYWRYSVVTGLALKDTVKQCSRITPENT